ncbi:formate dehydrogenase subunit gamma [Thiobacter aerophilum]|uniref:Formate dehydrogenase subunit gamma n=1 Tax=Thiobacter aerophilum TaxID=3121275 RepID=A0ABV0EFL0_9BURK
MSAPIVPRYSPRDRANHWVIAITFILLAISGLALFHPAFFFLSNLLGGGTWNRILHPFIGVVLLLSFTAFALRLAADNRITAADREWKKYLPRILRNEPVTLPKIGKYNIGQKYLFWSLVVLIPLLFFTGIVIWQPWFASYFSVGLIRLAVLVHAAAAFLAMLAIIVHIYSAIWTKGSIRAMTRGTVSAAWAKHHHPAWYEEVSRSR